MLAQLFFLLGVLAAEGGWNSVVIRAMQQPLPSMRDTELQRICFAIVFWHVSWFPAKKFNHRVITQMKIERLLQIHYTGKRDGLPQRTLMCSQAQRQLPAGGMPHHSHALSIQTEPGVFLTHVTVCRPDIRKC